MKYVCVRLFIAVWLLLSYKKIKILIIGYITLQSFFYPIMYSC